MDIWKGTIAPFQKHVTDGGFVPEVPDLDEDPGTDQYWERYNEEYGYTINTAKRRASELENEDPPEPQKILGVLFVTLDGEYTLNYLSNFQQYLDFKASGFDTTYFNDKIRVTPFPFPFGRTRI